MNHDDTPKTYTPEEMGRIIADNCSLSEQVKRLVKTEYELYNTQSELDSQIVMYKGLYETGKKITTPFRINAIFSEMGDFIIDRLNYGGYLLFERKKTSCVIVHAGGSCAARTASGKRSCTIRWMDSTLCSVKARSSDCFVNDSVDGDRMICEARSFFGLTEFVIHPFYIGKTETPAYLLVVGNPTEKEYFTALAPNTIMMIGLNNLVSLIENALNNVIHYKQVAEERKLLERKVDERTRDLNRALKDLKKLNARLNFLSFKDELTGLYNRRGFYIFGEKYFTMAQRKKTSLLILYCDLDRFKAINDRYGHKEGDVALKATATILKNAFRKYDIISRLGGDEFVVLLDNTPANEYADVKTRLNGIIVDYNRQSGKPYEILISYGYASYAPELRPECTFEALIEEADAMLYEEKRRRKRRLERNGE